MNVKYQIDYGIDNSLLLFSYYSWLQITWAFPTRGGDTIGTGGGEGVMHLHLFQMFVFLLY